MTAGLVLDEFDVNLPPLTSRLVIIFVVVVGRSRDARTLDASNVGAVAGRIVMGGGRGIGVSDLSHFWVVIRESFGIVVEKQ